jgi:hypothetical protein
VPPGQALTVGAGKVDVSGDPVVRAGAVAPLEQEPGGHPGGRVEPGELRPPPMAQLPAGQAGPERALAVEGLRRDIQAQLVRAARARGVRPERPRHGVLAVPAHQAEREPARAVRDDQAVFGVPDGRAQVRGLGRGLVYCPGRGVDVQVQVVAAGAVRDALHPQVRVAAGRQQRGELPGRAAERRQRGAGHLAPERHPGVERRAGEIEEDGEPPERHASSMPHQRTGRAHQRGGGRGP